MRHGNRSDLDEEILVIGGGPAGLAVCGGACRPGIDRYTAQGLRFVDGTHGDYQAIVLARTATVA